MNPSIACLLRSHLSLSAIKSTFHLVHVICKLRMGSLVFMRAVRCSAVSKRRTSIMRKLQKYILTDISARYSIPPYAQVR
jgi:hypothetical protein